MDNKKNGIDVQRCMIVRRHGEGKILQATGKFKNSIFKDNNVLFQSKEKTGSEAMFQTHPRYSRVKLHGYVIIPEEILTEDQKTAITKYILSNIKF